MCVLTNLLSWPSIAYGQSDEADTAPSVSLSANISIVSDYRFRGLSLSNRDPALQGGVDASTKAGFFAGVWTSTVADTGGSNNEVDLYGGYANSLSGLDYSLRAVGYVYPGGEDVNYYELFANVGKTLGAATVQLQLAYIPSQDNFANENIYAGASGNVALPGTQFMLNAAFGRESSTGFRKWDWRAGVSWTYDIVTLSATYVDSDFDDETEAGRLGSAGAIISLSANF